MLILMQAASDTGLLCTDVWEQNYKSFLWQMVGWCR